MPRTLSLLITFGVGSLLGLLFFASMNIPPLGAVKLSRAASHSTLSSTRPMTPAKAKISSQAATTTMVFDAIEVVASVATTPEVDQLARGLALAMDIPPEDIALAELMCDHDAGRCTDPKAVAILGLAPGTWFPTRGPSFAYLSTGTATDLAQTEMFTEPFEFSDSPPEELNGLKSISPYSEEAGDLVRLHLRLNVPPDAKCLSFDFTFYTVDIYTDTTTETIPQSCSELKGDTFTAQYNNSFLGFDGSEVYAPGNFAFNERNKPVTSYTMSPERIYEALNSPLGTHVPGVFPLLQARQAVSGDQVDLYLSIQDVVDASGNSAVALDNFRWITDTTKTHCTAQTGWSGDRDDDGLPDGWEEYGVYVRDQHQRLVLMNLKELGADPDVKDIFVEVDSLAPLYKGGFDPQPIPQAMSTVVEAFMHAPVDEKEPTTADGSTQFKGIRLHVDFGPHAPMLRSGDDATSQHLWGELSGSDIISEPAYLHKYLCAGTCNEQLEPLWIPFDEIKQRYFAVERSRIFHYALFAHILATCRPLSGSQYCLGIPSISGISRNISDTTDGASDFIVTLAHSDWRQANTPLVDQQAGTFMHELGHNLGLNHYGTIANTDNERILGKPNHLSVMNYNYQMHGLVVSEPRFRFDYSRYNMIPLNEKHLIESEGIYLAASGVSVTYTIGVRHYCQTTQQHEPPIEDATSVDWNCNGVVTDVVSHNITGDSRKTSSGGREDVLSEKLEAHSEWDKLIFTGGLLYRQRNMIRPYVLERPSPCKFAPLIFEPGSSVDHSANTPPSYTRRYIPSEEQIVPVTTEQALEELTADNQRRIPR